MSNPEPEGHYPTRYVDAEAESLLEWPDEEEHRRRIRQIMEEAGMPIPDWKPIIPRRDDA